MEEINPIPLLIEGSISVFASPFIPVIGFILSLIGLISLIVGIVKLVTFGNWLVDLSTANQSPVVA